MDDAGGCGWLLAGLLSAASRSALRRMPLCWTGGFDVHAFRIGEALTAQRVASLYNDISSQQRADQELCGIARRFRNFSWKLESWMRFDHSWIRSRFKGTASKILGESTCAQTEFSMARSTKS